MHNKKLQSLKYLSKDLRTVFSLRLKGKLRLIGLIDENTGILKLFGMMQNMKYMNYNNYRAI